MPWDPKDAERHTKKADTPAKQRLWSQVANREREAGKSDAEAVRAANSAVKHAASKT